VYHVYVIKCETPNHYYIGLTRNYYARIRAHRQGRGARFTQVYGFREVTYKETCRSKEDAKIRESELAKVYIETYGVKNVAGAGWSQVLKGNINARGADAREDGAG
jgi:putative endonuclease